MPAPTIQAVAKQVLRDWGITSLDPTTPAGQTNPIRPSDLEACAFALSMAFQEIAGASGNEGKTQPGWGMIFPPVNLTLTVTNGSPVIGGVTTYLTWMPGCTIRIAGDNADNELLTATLLARPYVGTSGATTATIWCDAITLDDTTNKVLAPMLVGANWPVEEVTSRHEFITRGGFQVPQVYHQGYANLPFWSFTNKPTATQPNLFFLDSYYDVTLDYVARRIRFSPMPTAAAAVGWTKAVNPRRVLPAEIDPGSHAETNLKIPILDGWVEAVFIPIARQNGTSFPQFKNEDMRQEIGRQYARALQRLSDARATAAPARTRYV